MLANLLTQMAMKGAMSTALNEAPLEPSPLLIFVLGKSTLCDALADRYELDHFSIGNEMRQLITNTPTGPAALIKPTLTADEIATLTQTVTANALAPMALATKYVKERVFGVGAIPGVTRTLIDGFPRDAARWQHFKEIAQESWTPSELSVVIVLHASRELTRERFETRGRAGDSFDKRFDQHEEQIGPIVEAMRQDGLTIIEISANHERTAEELVESFEEMPAWGRAVGRVPAVTGEDSTHGESKG